MMCPDWSGGQIAVVAATVAIRASSVSASFGEIEISEFHEWVLATAPSNSVVSIYDE